MSTAFSRWHWVNMYSIATSASDPKNGFLYTIIFTSSVPETYISVLYAKLHVNRKFVNPHFVKTLFTLYIIFLFYRYWWCKNSQWGIHLSEKLTILIQCQFFCIIEFSISEIKWLAYISYTVWFISLMAWLKLDMYI